MCSIRRRQQQHGMAWHLADPAHLVQRRQCQPLPPPLPLPPLLPAPPPAGPAQRAAAWQWIGACWGPTALLGRLPVVAPAFLPLSLQSRLAGLSCGLAGTKLGFGSSEIGTKCPDRGDSSSPGWLHGPGRCLLPRRCSSQQHTSTTEPWIPRKGPGCPRQSCPPRCSAQERGAQR